jgi:hypothetical protein
VILDEGAEGCVIAGVLDTTGAVACWVCAFELAVPKKKQKTIATNLHNTFMGWTPSATVTHLSKYLIINLEIRVSGQQVAALPV